jgi:6-phosphogluconolactonase
MAAAANIDNLEGFWKFRTREIQTATLARHIAVELRKSAEIYGYASLVVPGGTTPQPLLQALGKEDLPWKKIWLTLTDERWVPAKHENSNEKTLREWLPLDEMHYVPLHSRHRTPQEAQVTIEAALRKMPRPFDIVVCGMGADGHIASLFPKANELKDGLNIGGAELCIAIEGTDQYEPRMSLTLTALRNSHKRLLLIQGEAKWETIKQAQKEETSSFLMPVKALLQTAPTTICWAP